MTDSRLARFRRWFWQPPRAHGEVLHDRAVSGLELYYDLVFVAVIIQLAHHLSEHLTVRGVVDFSVIFTLIFIAWVNGSLYLELHGHEDGRTRTIVFAQMGILALLAVLIADAGSRTGDAFTLVYALLLAVMTWLWQTARLQSGRARTDATPVLGRYVRLMAAAVVVLVLAVLLPPQLRVLTWAAFAVVWVGGVWLAGRAPLGLPPGLVPTEALIERFGLLVIIVLGEVFFGVVNGLVAVERDLVTVGTGMLTLLLGFVIWWIYFDLVGRRHPRADGPAMSAWMLWHLPLTLAIAAIGAAGVDLIAHANDASTPSAIAWVMGASVAIALLALIMVERTLAEASRLPSVYRPVGVATVGGAGAALLAASIQPAPWLLAVLLVTILGVLWLFTVGRFMTSGDTDGAVGSGSD